MKLFDCYCCFGRISVPPPRFAENAQQLVDEMEYCGINEALVYHSAMRYGSPLIGNKLVVEEIKGFPNLHATWAILPHQTGEQEPPDIFLETMKANNIKALYALPEEHGYSLDEVGFGELFEELLEHRIPLFMWADWNLVGRVLKQFPKLIIVVFGHGPHGDDRYFRPLIERYSNLYIDTSTYLQDGGIEGFCNSYGAEHLLFSTGYPQNCIGGPVLRIVGADITDFQRELICSGNIERLLKEVRL